MNVEIVGFEDGSYGVRKTLKGEGNYSFAVWEYKKFQKWVKTSTTRGVRVADLQDLKTRLTQMIKDHEEGTPIK